MSGGTNRYSWNAAVKSRQLDSRMLPPKQQPLFDEEAPRVARGAGNTRILKFGVRGGVRDSAVILKFSEIHRVSNLRALSHT